MTPPTTLNQPAAPAPHPMLALSEEVAAGIRDGAALVALESTIISHGMPYPRNVEMALEIEGIIRDAGAVPATISVLDGVPRIGLSRDELETLASHGGVAKVSLRDLPYVIARRAHGATTVASTMRLAALAGIRVFVTGGLGGVHRGAETSFDISADLTELGQTDVAVVSAGVKSILDIGLTLESLETLGVPVVGFGTDELPSFYSRTSGHRSPMRVDTVEELAAMMRAKWDLGLAGGISIANPVPAEDEIPAAEIGALIDQALIECEERGIRGKDITPFLLGRIVELSGGRSLETNIALVRSNARLGAALALAYQRLA
jgi:pseudouridine-5'-phosphate glycosidase